MPQSTIDTQATLGSLKCKFTSTEKSVRWTHTGPPPRSHSYPPDPANLDRHSFPFQAPVYPRQEPGA